jgi:hypothetical protein
MNKRLVATLFLGLVVLLGLATALLIGMPGSEDTTTTTPPAEDRPATKRTVTRQDVAATPPGTEPPVEDWESTLYAEAAPDQAIIRCRVAGLLPDGAYATSGTRLSLPVVRSGWLTAAVPEPAGHSMLTQNLQPVAQVRWSGAASGVNGCRVSKLELHTVSGRVVGPEGMPVADVQIRACDHGEIVRSDEDGAFSLGIPAGFDCHPMAFIEHEDGSLSKGTFTELSDVDRDIEDITLKVPDYEESLTIEQLAAMAERLADMNEGMVARRQAEIDRLNALLDGGTLDADGQARLRAHVQAEEQLVGRMVDQMERLRDPDDQANAMREAWLNLY